MTLTIKQIFLNARLIPAWIGIVIGFASLISLYEYTGLVTETKMQLPNMEVRIKNVKCESLNQVKDIAIRLNADRITQYEVIQNALLVISLLSFWLAYSVIFLVLKIIRLQAAAKSIGSDSIDIKKTKDELNKP